MVNKTAYAKTAVCKGVDSPNKKVIKTITRELIQKVLRERLSLRGICRVFDVSMSWLMWFATVVCQTAREDLCVRFDTPPISEDWIFGAGELCTYVGKKVHKVWIWRVMERETRQIIALEIGERSAHTCEKL